MTRRQGELLIVGAIMAAKLHNARQAKRAMYENINAVKMNK